MKNPKTVEKPNDFETRVNKFSEELVPLLNKYKLGLAAQPFIDGEGKILARPNMVDAKKLVKSEINEG